MRLILNAVIVAIMAASVAIAHAEPVRCQKESDANQLRSMWEEAILVSGGTVVPPLSESCKIIKEERELQIFLHGASLQLLLRGSAHPYTHVVEIFRTSRVSDIADIGNEIPTGWVVVPVDEIPRPTLPALPPRALHIEEQEI